MSRRAVTVGAAVAVVGIVLLVVLGGGQIGDGDGDAGEGPADGGAGSASTSSPGPTSTIAPADQPFCDAFGALLVGPLADPETDSSDPTILAAAVDVTDALLDALAAAAPEELQDPVAQLAVDYRGAFAIFERYDFDIARVFEEATAEEQAVLDAFGAGPDEGDDPLVPVEEFVVDHCATDPVPDL